MIVEHVGVSVSDLDRSVEFYAKVLGFRVMRRTATSAYLHLGNDLLELMQSGYPVKVERPSTPEDWSKRMHDDLGLSHIGFRVENLDETLKAIKDLGGRVVIPPYNFEPKIQYTTDQVEDKLRRVAKPPQGRLYWRIAVFSDPDGTLLELVER
jgi:catechol 2,3-dioxygenase-like lactoylglutathione lyase family enzyme